MESWQARAKHIDNWFLADEWRSVPETVRRARLIVAFGFLGFVFGMAYAAFYFAIDHRWGAGIVTICSFAFAATPFLLRATRHLKLTGNLLTAIMTFGFTALSCVEGGLRGHAVAWLASVPLCALLLTGKSSARFWVLVCFIVGGLAVAAELAGVALPITYDPAWHPLVSSAGYIGLIAFLFALGMIFETGRENAFHKMQEALGQVVKSNEQLLVLNREKTEFLGIAAHDLRNPLTTIIASAQILERSDNPADMPRFAGAIHSAGTRMRDLIVNLLDANALEEGRFSCKIERCEINALIAQAIEQNQLNATRKKISIEPPENSAIWAKADQSTTVQVLDNLISNAVKYSPLKSTIRIASSFEDNEVCVAVQDEGPGLSVEDQKKLFGKFMRLSAQPTGGESSTGLGLSIAKRLAEAMSGSLECQSILGHGATFVLRLPAWNTR